MTTKFFTGILILFLFLSFSVQGIAQEDTRPAFVAMQHTSWNMELNDDTASPEEWEALAKEYNEKVTMKNEFIRGTAVLTHRYTADNADVLLITTYNSWADIESSQDRNDELEVAAWPDKDKRMAFMKKMNRYFVNKHADEIYATTDGAKFPPDRTDTERIAYMQKLYRAYPDDGTPEEFAALNKEYIENVIHKNPHLIAFYPMQHAWGADNREIIHVYVVSSLADLSAMNTATTDLEKAAWPDEAKRKEFFKKYDRYFNGHHGDYIYATIPGVSK